MQWESNTIPRVTFSVNLPTPGSTHMDKLFYGRVVITDLGSTYERVVYILQWRICLRNTWEGKGGGGSVMVAEDEKGLFNIWPFEYGLFF